MNIICGLRLCRGRSTRGETHGRLPGVVRLHGQRLPDGDHVPPWPGSRTRRQTQMQRQIGWGFITDHFSSLIYHSSQVLIISNHLSTSSTSSRQKLRHFRFSEEKSSGRPERLEAEATEMSLTLVKAEIEDVQSLFGDEKLTTKLKIHENTIHLDVLKNCSTKRPTSLFVESICLLHIEAVDPKEKRRQLSLADAAQVEELQHEIYVARDESHQSPWLIAPFIDILAGGLKYNYLSSNLGWQANLTQYSSTGLKPSILFMHLTHIGFTFRFRSWSYNSSVSRQCCGIYKAELSCEPRGLVSRNNPIQCVMISKYVADEQMSFVGITCCFYLHKKLHMFDSKHTFFMIQVGLASSVHIAPAKNDLGRGAVRPGIFCCFAWSQLPKALRKLVKALRQRHPIMRWIPQEAIVFCPLFGSILHFCCGIALSNWAVDASAANSLCTFGDSVRCMLVVPVAGCGVSHAHGKSYGCPRNCAKFLRKWRFNRY